MELLTIGTDTRAEESNPTISRMELGLTGLILRHIGHTPLQDIPI